MPHPSQAPSLRSTVIFSSVLGYALAFLVPRTCIRSSPLLTCLVACLLSISLVVIYDSQVWPKLLSPLRHLPQPPDPAFWHGHAWKLTKGDPTPIWKEWFDTIPNHGLIRFRGLFNREILMLTTPEAMRQVLVTESYDFPKPAEGIWLLRRIIGSGLVVAEGDEHRQQRKSLTPAFQYRYVKDLVPIFWAKSADMIRKCAEDHKAALDSPEGAAIKFTDWVTRCTLDIIGITGMGFDFKAIDHPNSELYQTYQRVFSPSKQDILIGILRSYLPAFVVRLVPLGRNRSMEGDSAALRRISRNLVLEKSETLRSSRDNTENKDILSIAMRNGGISEEGLIDQTMTLLAAGHETTSTSTTWALVALSRHPDVQRKLRAEVRAQLPSLRCTDPVTSEMLDLCPYLHAVCSEVLRFYPPIAGLGREAAKDTVIAGVTVRAGTRVVTAPCAINLSEQFWGPDAKVFRPERWLVTNSGGALSNFSMSTFMHGPRSCIGQAFAKHEFACLLGAIVSFYHFELDKPDEEIVVLQAETTYKPKDGVVLRMKRAE